MSLTELNIQSKPDLLGELGSRPLTPHEMEIVATMLSNTGNEAHLGIIGEMASTSGGKIGNMKGLAAGVDAAYEAKQGSISKNLSSGARNEHQADFKNEGEGFPVVNDEYGLRAAEDAINNRLTAEGVPQEDLDRTLDAGGPDNIRASLTGFHGLASAMGLTAVVEYIEDTDAYAQSIEVEAGVKDVAPIAGTTLDVTPPQNDLENTVEPGGPSVAGLKL